MHTRSTVSLISNLGAHDERRQITDVTRHGQSEGQPRHGAWILDRVERPNGGSDALGRSAHRHSRMTRSTFDVTSPFALTVWCRVVCMSRLLPLPWPMIQVLSMNVSLVGRGPFDTVVS